MPQKRFASPGSRAELIIHCIQLALVVIVIGLSVPRLFMKGQPTTRANTIALGMGAKSIFLILYQVLTVHTQYFRRWASVKANAIINCLETTFWGAVIFLMIRANIQVCIGVGCILSWIVVGLAIVLTLLAIYTAFISTQQYRGSRAQRKTRGASLKGSGKDLEKLSDAS